MPGPFTPGFVADLGITSPLSETGAIVQMIVATALGVALAAKSIPEERSCHTLLNVASGSACPKCDGPASVVMSAADRTVLDLSKTSRKELDAMTELKRLMVCTDLSAPARHAASRAASVAHETGADLELVHVVSPAPLEKLRRIVAHLPAGLEARWLQAARTRLEDLAVTLQREHAKLPAVHVATGAVSATLAHRADERAADLLVLGARGEGFMRHLLLGSTAERMLGRATRPMLIVKQAAHRPYRSVLVAVDFSSSSLEAVRLARAVAPKASVTVLHAFEVPFEGQLRFGGVEPEIIDSYRIAARQEAMHALHALCDEAGLPPAVARPLVMHGNPVLRVLEQEQEQDADLIVVGKHGESALESLFLGSVTRELLARSQGDVLVSVRGERPRL